MFCCYVLQSWDPNGELKSLRELMQWEYFYLKDIWPEWNSNASIELVSIMLFDRNCEDNHTQQFFLLSLQLIFVGVQTRSKLMSIMAWPA